MEGVELLSVFVAMALPGGLVRKSAYSSIKRRFLEELAGLLPLDGLCLELHGALEVEDVGDGERDFAQAIRGVIGDSALVAASLDLHGNLDPAISETIDILTAYRTAPHRDEVETRARALALLVGSLQAKRRPVSAVVKLPLLLPGEWAMTDYQPARSLYERVQTLAHAPGILDASILIGCAWTDSPVTGASVVVVGEAERDIALHNALHLASSVWEKRREFSCPVECVGVDEAVRRAARSSRTPVFISDSGDNVTAGAPGDSPVVLRQLLSSRVEGALVAGLCDPVAVRRCVAAGIGSTVRLDLGASCDLGVGPPVRAEVKIERLASDPDRPEPTIALVRLGGVRVLVTSDRRPFPDRASIAFAAGCDPMAERIVVVKLGYLFPDLADTVPRAIIALSPGATSLRLDDLPYRALSRPIFPLDRQASWSPQPGSGAAVEVAPTNTG